MLTLSNWRAWRANLKHLALGADQPVLAGNAEARGRLPRPCVSVSREFAAQGGVIYSFWFGTRCWESYQPGLLTGVLPAVQVIDLGDTMDFALLPPDRQQDELTCDMEGVPTDESNLVLKARWCWLD